ncbi:hypothetical protein [Streptomyces sp. NPDC048192]|uniref:hypothetical protein n=1 Tax=Streptomyces sp. NPDC048192 TaxID=3365510 RepID=UPI0037172CB2
MRPRATTAAGILAVPAAPAGGFGTPSPARGASAVAAVSAARVGERGVAVR